jgi:hypothetical protein
MVYFEKLKKLLVLYNAPVFTRPSPEADEPGASAYTIDLSTKEITPYLMTDNRKAYLEQVEQWEKSYYAFQPISECQANTTKFPPGTTIYSTLGNDDHLIVLGYDCNEQVYVVSTRELYQDAGRYGQRVRIVKRSPGELGYHKLTDVQYKICTECAGQPYRTHTSSYTGWTNWEQQNFNIHTRRYVVDKTVKEQTSCKACDGGWMRK